jgi:hypothetical protein
MKNEFIPYEQALALKGLGFDEQCFSFYNAIGELYESEGYYSYSKNVHQFEVVAPLYQQAFRWFREKYVFYINMVAPDLFYFVIHYINPIKEPTDLFIGEHCDTYEEAELACLKKLIKLLTPSQL